MAKKQLSRSQKKRLKKKQQAEKGTNVVRKQENAGSIAAQALREISAKAPLPKVDEEIEIEYVSAGTREVASNQFPELAQVLGKFSTVEDLVKPEDEKAEAADKENKAAGEKDGEEDADKPLSKRKQKKLKRLTVAQLKALVRRPDKVETWDTTSSDPRLLLHLKAYRNSVPVPRHWSHKRKYLQGKRGIEKPPFELPDFIAATGVTRIKEAVEEADADKGSKARARERLHGKMGKVNIDPQVMHDAFFRFQTKPSMTGHGDIYYEGKEFEVDFKEKRPGVLSGKLREALGMGELDPPPWLISMQRYGPPPSYPHLKIPGLNAPIPSGAQFGYGPGAWGKPPVDAMGRPLYGDVFGAERTDAEKDAAEMDTSKWGEIEEEEFESESESEGDDDDDEGEGEGSDADDAIGPEAVDAADPGLGAATPAGDGGMSVATGMYTPSSIDPRKEGTETPSSAAPKQLYQVLEQKKASVGNALFGSSHTYAVPRSDVYISLDPEELATLDEAALRQKYEEAVEAQQNGRGNPSNTSLVAEVLAERRRKRRPQTVDGGDAKKARSGR